MFRRFARYQVRQGRRPDDPTLRDALAAAAARGVVLVGAAGESADPPGAGEWWPISALDAAGLPTLFAKAAQRALATGRETQ